jgi:uncharacterized protein
VNACAPEPARSEDFVAALAAAMHRPALVPLPEPIVRGIFGEMGEQTLLASQRAIPKKLTESGFHFLHKTIAEGVEAGLHC